MHSTAVVMGTSVPAANAAVNKKESIIPVLSVKKHECQEDRVRKDGQGPVTF